MDEPNTQVHLQFEDSSKLFCLTYAKDKEAILQVRMTFDQLESFGNGIMSVIRAVQLEQAKEYLRRKNEEQKLIEDNGGGSSE